MTTDVISPDLKIVLRRLKLSRMPDTLPERLALARQQKMRHQEWLVLVLGDEWPSRQPRGHPPKAHFDPAMHLEWGTFEKPGSEATETDDQH